jgi:SAM-dependent methyltransferase
MQLAETFDHVADLYDASRPGYPRALFDTLMRAGRLEPGDPVLEVGCGTGQATEGLRRRGLAVTGLDPGPELVRHARRRFGDTDDLDFVTARFEDWTPPREAFRMVASAQAWHWIPPGIAFAKAAQALAPGGLLAVFGNVPAPPPDADLAALAPLFARHAPKLWNLPPESWYLPQGPVAGLFAISGLFEAVHHAAFPWTWRKSVREHLDFLRSRSDYQMVEAGSREALLAEIGALLRARSGEDLELAYEAHLYWARRRPG